MFSNLVGEKLEKVILEIENFDLLYRKVLDLPLFVSFGVEIEYEHLSKEKVDNYFSSDGECWISKEDSSLIKGGEVNSPIMFDTIQCWEDLKRVCHYLKLNHVDTLHNSGGHVHVGAHVLGDDYRAWIIFLKMYIVLNMFYIAFFMVISLVLEKI